MMGNLGFSAREMERGLILLSEVAREADKLDPFGAAVLRQLTTDRPWWSRLLPFEFWRNIVLRRHGLASPVDDNAQPRHQASKYAHDAQ